MAALARPSAMEEMQKDCRPLLVNLPFFEALSDSDLGLMKQP